MFPMRPGTNTVRNVIGWMPPTRRCALRVQSTAAQNSPGRTTRALRCAAKRRPLNRSVTHVRLGFHGRRGDQLTFAAPLRRVGANLVMDLHPGDRGRHGTFEGAIAANGGLFCPATPEALLDLGPLKRGATPDEVAAHDARFAELIRYKFSALSAPDGDGYQRVICPGCRRQGPLPAQGSFFGPVVGPPERVAPAERTSALLRPSEHHRRAAGEREDPSKARLRRATAPRLVGPAHRGGAHVCLVGRPLRRGDPPGLVPPVRSGQEHAHVRPRRRGAQRADRRVLRTTSGPRRPSCRNRPDAAPQKAPSTRYPGTSERPGPEVRSAPG
jgi:hypothetical protein